MRPIRARDGIACSLVYPKPQWLSNRLRYDGIMDHATRNERHLVHGAATWSVRADRKQVCDDVPLPAKLVPVVTATMRGRPAPTFGDVCYPVVEPAV